MKDGEWKMENGDQEEPGAICFCLAASYWLLLSDNPVESDARFCGFQLCLKS
jgi:hypothetical protein